MKYIVTGKQMQKADQYTINTIGIPSIVLMERAALKCVEILEQEVSDLSKVLVVCGVGNNGGDGYAIARLLYLKGYQVSVVSVGNMEKQSPENKKQKEILDYYRIPVKQEIENKEYSIIIDAVFGTGLSRDVSGAFYNIIEQMNQMQSFKVAVDTPSGLHDETGEAIGIAFKADLTIALAYAKRGQVAYSGNPYVGKLCVADIGIYSDAIGAEETVTYCYDYGDFQKEFPKRNPNSHKGTYGKVLLIVGSTGMSGAAYLCAKASYTVGAGLVQIYTHEDNRIILQRLLPEAIVTTYEEYDEGQLQSLLDWADVIGIGCGLGTSEMSERIVKYVITQSTSPCVVDADALNIIAQDIDILKQAKQSIVMTPHMKEMSRLLSCSVMELKQQKFEKLQTFANRYNVTCVLKDSRTLIYTMQKNIFLNLTGNSAMAKGGSGDVLTGIIVGIMAQKKDAHESACLGVYLHGLSGESASKEKGNYSVLAEDIVEHISEVLKEIPEVV